MADESTRTVEPAGGQGDSDAIESEIIEINSVSTRSGSSGLQIIFKPQILLEGLRPRRVVRLVPSCFDILPPEEHLEYLPGNHETIPDGCFGGGSQHISRT